MTLLADAYDRLIRFHERWKALVQIALGLLWTATSVFLAVVATIVFTQQANEHHAHEREARTVRVACERSRVFGPPFLEFLTLTESRLEIHPLDQPLKADGKQISVLDFYRSTIPRGCPR